MEYRLLNIGEIIKEGDECSGDIKYFKDALLECPQWFKSTSAVGVIYDGKCGKLQSSYYRREIKEGEQKQEVRPRMSLRELMNVYDL